MKKQKKTNKGLKHKLSPNEAFVKAVKYSYLAENDNAFYTTIALTEKSILDIKIDGNVFKAVRIEGETKILARIEDAVYNFPAIVTAQGTRAKLIAAYAELKERESLESVK